MKPVMYSFINKGLGMTPGKMTAQGQHAAVQAFRISKPHITSEWDLGGHEAKVVLEAESTEHLMIIQQYINDRGFKTRLIIDEGRTEIAPHSPTALGIEIVDKDDEHVRKTFEGFRTYKEAKVQALRKRLPSWIHRRS